MDFLQVILYFVTGSFIAGLVIVAIKNVDKAMPEDKVILLATVTITLLWPFMLISILLVAVNRIIKNKIRKE